MRFEVIQGTLHRANKVVVYGPEGIGKSTFVSHFPQPLFIDTEGSTNKLDVRRFPKPSSWQMLKDEVTDVINERPCRTLVIDTADWAERLCIESVLQAHGKKGIEDFGYGNGYTYVAEEWGRFLNLLQDVIDVANINVVLTAHAIIRKFEQPNEMGSYDRYELKLGKKTTAQTAPLTKEWADMVLFANYKTIVYNVDGQGAQKGKNKVQGGKRVIYTTHHPCWDAKNRYGLPDEIPMDYNEIRHVIEDQAVKADQTPPKDKKAPVKQSAPESAEPDKSHQEPAKEEKATQPMDQKQEPVNPPDPRVDERIPKALRDLMIANGVDEWDIQNVVAARGYFPADMVVADYPADFVSGVLVGAWTQVYAMIKEMKEKDSLVFN